MRLADRAARANDETPVPPHPKRPVAASPERTEPRARRRSRAAGLALTAVAVAALTAACGLSPGPPPPPSPEEAIIHEVFDPLSQGAKAVSVARCESGLNPLAGWPNATYKGLFQLGPHVAAINAYGGNWFDARQNTLAARDLYVSRGSWSAWSCR